MFNKELVVLSSISFLQEAVLNPPYGKFNLTQVEQQCALVNLQLTFVIRSTEGRRLLSHQQNLRIITMETSLNNKRNLRAVIYLVANKKTAT